MLFMFTGFDQFSWMALHVLVIFILLCTKKVFDSFYLDICHSLSFSLAHTRCVDCAYCICGANNGGMDHGCLQCALEFSIVMPDFHFVQTFIWICPTQHFSILQIAYFRIQPNAVKWWNVKSVSKTTPQHKQQ